MPHPLAHQPRGPFVKADPHPQHPRPLRAAKHPKALPQVPAQAPLRRPRKARPRDLHLPHPRQRKGPHLPAIQIVRETVPLILHAPQVIRPRPPRLQLRAPQLLVVKGDLHLPPHRPAHLLKHRQVRPARSALAKRDRLQLAPVQRDPPLQARRDLLASRPQRPLKSRPPMLLQRLLRDEERHHLPL